MFMLLRNVFLPVAVFIVLFVGLMWFLSCVLVMYSVMLNCVLCFFFVMLVSKTIPNNNYVLRWTCPSFRMKQSDLNSKDFRDILYLGLFLKFVATFRSKLKWGKSHRHYEILWFLFLSLIGLYNCDGMCTLWLTSWGRRNSLVSSM